MNKIKFVYAAIRMAVCCFLLLSLTGCEKVDTVYNYDDEMSGSSRVSEPSFGKFLTVSTYDQIDFKIRFKHGGDTRDNMHCTIYWKAYASKPSSTPKPKDLTKVETMRLIDHTKTKSVFDKSHVGFYGGTYIYYYAVCKNSKGSCETPIDYTIIKRL